jgi:hypothetical protein
MWKEPLSVIQKYPCIIYFFYRPKDQIILKNTILAQGVHKTTRETKVTLHNNLSENRQNNQQPKASQTEPSRDKIRD